MRKIKIVGQKELNGEIVISGSKNAALGVIASSLLCKDKVILTNVPYIQDTLDMIEILKELNVEAKFKDDILIIDSKNIMYNKLINPLVKKFRASYYFMGVLLALFNKCEIIGPGGCNFGDRPIDIHLDFFSKMGTTIECEEHFIFVRNKPHLKEYTFKKKSVGASINALLYLSAIEEEITLHNISIEPEVIQVIEALIAMGVSVRLINDTCIIKGVKKKKSFEIRIIPDRIEIGTYAFIGAMCAKKICLKNIEVNHLSWLIDLLNKLNIKFEISKEMLVVFKSEDIKGTKIKTEPYPGFPTDLQQPLTTLLLTSSSDSVIEETIYSSRMAHVNELVKMGAKLKVINNKIYIKGNNSLVGCKLSGKELRGGASLIMAALISNGESIIEGLEYIERGYTRIIDNLKRLGANIDVIET